MSAAQAAAREQFVSEYEAIKAINWSSLKHIGTSPLEYRWRLAHPEPRKPAFVFGGAVHCAVLEPEKFDSRYAVYDGIRRGKDWEAWKAIHPGVESLKPDEYDRVQEIAVALRFDGLAAKLLAGGRCEEALTWSDDDTGLACKGRVDYIRPDCVIDLKTTRDPAPRKFERAAASYGYAGQVAFYHDGATARHLIDGRTMPFIVSVQTKAPYDVVSYQLDAEALDIGRAQYKSLLRQLVDCTAADYWPGVAPELQKLRLPHWAAGQQIEQESEDF